jgi:hypothetical protein
MRPKRNTVESSRVRARLAAAVVSCAVVSCAAVAAVSCAGNRPRPAESSGCAVLDTLLASSGLEEPVSIAGHATVDANQFRMKGKILLEARGAAEIVFEFTSAVLFGQEREDFVFSLLSDTLRIVDRERGAFYEGEDAARFLAESLEADFDVAQALSLAFGGSPPCGELSGIRCGADAEGAVSCEGKRYGKPFKAVFDGEGGRLGAGEWPVRSDRYGGDRLRVEYEWKGGGGLETLAGVVLSLEARGWRCKIRASETG